MLKSFESAAEYFVSVLPFVYLILIIIQIFVTVILFLKKWSESPKKDTIYRIVVSAAILLSSGIGLWIGMNYVKMPTDTNAIPDDIAKALLEQQSNTLAVSAISVAVVSIVTAFISVLKELKSKSYNDEIEKTNKDLEVLKEEIEKYKRTSKALEISSAINAVQIIAPNENFGYFDLMNEIYSEENANVNEYTKLAILKFIMDSMYHADPNNENLEDIYKKIILVAKSIADNKNGGYEEQFALIESINATYRMYRAKLYRGEDQRILMEIKESLNRLVNLNRKDTYGYIDNLNGLISFWEGKACSDNAKKKKYFYNALAHYEKAIEKNEFFTQYHNNKLALYVSMLDNGILDEDMFSKIENTYKTIIKSSPNYEKAHVNFAHCYTTKFKQTFGISSEYSFFTYAKMEKKSDEIKEGFGYLALALMYLKRAIDSNYYFVDSHYNYALVLIFVMLLNINAEIYDNKRIHNEFNKITDRTKDIAGVTIQEECKRDLKLGIDELRKRINNKLKDARNVNENANTIKAIEDKFELLYNDYNKYNEDKKSNNG